MFKNLFIPELLSKPFIEIFDAPVHPWASGCDENNFNANIKTKSCKTTEFARVYKVPNKVHSIIDLQISWNRVIIPILNEKSNYSIHTFRIILLDVNLITDYIDKIE